MLLGLLASATMPNRPRLGTSSRMSSRRFPARSVVWIDRPVRLPPGRARLATRPFPSGSAASAKTIGMTEVACFAATIGTVAAVTMTSTLSRTSSAASSAARELGPLCPAYLDRDVAALDPTEFVQPLDKNGQPLPLGRRRGRTQVPDGRQLRLLRARSNRPRDCRATD